MARTAIIYQNVDSEKYPYALNTTFKLSSIYIAPETAKPVDIEPVLRLQCEKVKQGFAQINSSGIVALMICGRQLTGKLIRVHVTFRFRSETDLALFTMMYGEDPSKFYQSNEPSVQ